MRRLRRNPLRPFPPLRSKELSQTAPPICEATSRVLAIPELLSSIFIHCLSEDQEEPDDSKAWSLKLGRDQYLRPSENKAPLLVAHVCRGWRDVALNTPLLWARLHLEFSHELCEDTPRLERQLSALRFWLSNSQSIPISVRLRISWLLGLHKSWLCTQLVRRIPIESQGIFTAMGRLLFEHIHRWENIEIILPESSTAPFYGNIDRQYPHLQSLRIGRYCLPHADSFVGRNLFLLSAPNIKELALPGRSISGLGDTFDADVFPIGLHTLELCQMTLHIKPSMYGNHLRKLALRDVRLPRNIFSMFPVMFPLLENLMLVYQELFFARAGDQDNEDEGANTDNGFIVLDHLTTLRICAHAFYLLTPPLSIITTPALHHLALSIGLGFDDDIIRFLRRSQAPLQYFFYEGEASTGYNEWDVDFSDSSNDDGDDSSDSSSEDDKVAPDDTKVLEMLKEMPDLVELEIIEPALSKVMSFLEDPNHLPHLTRLYNDGSLVVARISDGSPIGLPGPCVQEILTLIDKRCRKRNAPVIEGRIWLEKLSLPVHKEHQRMIREDRKLLRAIVDFNSTHECQDSSNGGEFFDSFI